MRHTDKALVVHAVDGEVLDLSMAKDASGKTAERYKSQFRGRFHFDMAWIMNQSLFTNTQPI